MRGQKSVELIQDETRPAYEKLPFSSFEYAVDKEWSVPARWVTSSTSAL